MIAPCRDCRGSGRYTTDDPHRPGDVRVWRCDCQPNPPEQRRSRDDDLAAYLATLNFCHWEAPRA